MRKRVFFIGIDGTRQDAFKKAVQTVRDKQIYPDFLSILDQGVVSYQIYAGGHFYDDTKQTTISGPGWTTLLTGTWANTHHITDNNLNTSTINKEIPLVFNTIANLQSDAKTAAFVNWDQLENACKMDFQGRSIDHLVSIPCEKVHEYTKADELLTKASIDHLENADPTFSFLYIGSIDETGHFSEYGYGPDVKSYLDSILAAFEQIDRVMKVINSKRSNGEQWLVVLTTDHGGIDHDHGSQRWQDRQIFAVFNDPEDDRYKGGREINVAQGQPTVTATILNYLFPQEKFSWMDGLPFGTAPARMQYIRLDASWNVAEGFPMPLSVMSPFLESFEWQIQLIFPDRNEENLFIFLTDGQYLVLNLHTKDVQSPKRIVDDWPELTPYAISFLSVTKNSENDSFLFFLKDGMVLPVDMQSRKVLEWDCNSSDLRFLRLAAEKNKVTAILRNQVLENQADYYMLYGDTYFEYKCVEKKESVKPDWPSMVPYSRDVISGASLKGEHYFFMRPMPYN